MAKYYYSGELVDIKCNAMKESIYLSVTVFPTGKVTIKLKFVNDFVFYIFWWVIEPFLYFTTLEYNYKHCIVVKLYINTSYTNTILVF